MLSSYELATMLFTPYYHLFYLLDCELEEGGGWTSVPGCAANGLYDLELDLDYPGCFHLCELGVITPTLQGI